MALTEKQKKFADQYLIDLNATQAAIRAGYSANAAEVTACRLLTNAKVSEYIQQKQVKLQKKTDITQERVLTELAKVGFANITDYLEYKTAIREIGKDYNNEPIYDWEMLVNARDSSEVDGVPIQEVSIAKDGTFKFKMYNKLEALEKLGKHLGLFNDKAEKDPAELINGIQSLADILRSPVPNRGIPEDDE